MESNSEVNFEFGSESGTENTDQDTERDRETEKTSPERQINQSPKNGIRGEEVGNINEDWLPSMSSVNSFDDVSRIVTTPDEQISVTETASVEKAESGAVSTANIPPMDEEEGVSPTPPISVHVSSKSSSADKNPHGELLVRDHQTGSSATKLTSKSAKRGNDRAKSKGKIQPIRSAEHKFALPSLKDGSSSVARNPTGLLKPSLRMQRLIRNEEDAKAKVATSQSFDTQPSPLPERHDERVPWNEALASVNDVLYWSRRAIYDPRKRAFTLSYSREDGAVPNLHLRKKITFETPASRRILQIASKGTVSSRSVESQYSKTVLPQMFNAQGIPTTPSTWGVNFADKAQLEPDLFSGLPVRELREVAVKEPKSRPHTKMSPRLKSKGVSNARAKSAFAEMPSDCGTGTQTDFGDLHTAHTKHLVLEKDLINPKYPEKSALDNFGAVDNAYISMKRAMPSRTCVSARNPRKIQLKADGPSERADQLFPRRPVTTHQHIMKELYVTQSIFDQSKSIPMRQYFTT